MTGNLDGGSGMNMESKGRGIAETGERRLSAT
jgi:hypothetical protein